MFFYSLRRVEVTKRVSCTLLYCAWYLCSTTKRDRNGGFDGHVILVHRTAAERRVSSEAFLRTGGAGVVVVLGGVLLIGEDGHEMAMAIAYGGGASVTDSRFVYATRRNAYAGNAAH